MFLYTNIQFQDQEKLCCSEFTAGRLKIFVRNFFMKCTTCREAQLWHRNQMHSHQISSYFFQTASRR